MKILVVDDNEFIRTLLLEQLKAEGYEVITKSNADDGLKALAQDSFNLLITDIVMPQIDGAQLMRQVRQQKPDLPIIAITGGIENAQEDYANYADLFADKTLVKPIKKEELYEAVKALT